ncbi:DUF4350 domain-containing protein [Buchananella felis]|uniref:DUF4350 domain-containing protein n=1 Tax=Buchananella felis TaxID=3231492 RepID=UPI0035293C6B
MSAHSPAGFDAPAPARPAGIDTLFGTTPGGQENRRRVRRRAIWLTALVALAILVIAATRTVTSKEPLNPLNPHPNGAMAIAEVLRQNGVEVSVAHSQFAVRQQTLDNSVVVVADTGQLTYDKWRELLDLHRNLVLLVGPATDPRILETELVPAEGDAQNEATATILRAQCTEQHAQGAETLTGIGYVFKGAGCFPTDNGVAYQVRRDVVPGTDVHQVSDGYFLSNQHLAKEGNAALAMRLLGTSGHVVWYVPSASDLSTFDKPSSSSGMNPPWLPWLYVYAVVIVAALAAWRGRRLGPVVVERMPVVVPATETVRGRGILYLKSKDHAHAAAKLRAGAARRYRKALGLSRSASAAAFLNALQAESGLDRNYLSHLFYGPAPTTDAELVQLAQALRQVRKHYD